MILEGLVTTLDTSDRLNIAPMGPIVDPSMTTLVLRPFKTSRTFANLRASRQGVFHVTDDVWLLARAAVGEVDAPTHAADVVKGRVLADACRGYEFRVIEVDDREDRCTLRAEVVAARRMRDFLGFNRAKHAVVEAAILATRVALRPRDEILAELDRLGILVDKTGGQQEHRAFAFLREYVERAGESPGVREGGTP